jgi:UDP-glucose 4-epimerase
MREERSQPSTGQAGRGRRILVTGASGFIGRHLTAALLRDGWEVTAVTRRPGLSPAPVGMHVVQGDLTDPQTVDRVIAGADSVCHLAALIPSDLEDATAARACLEMNALVALRIAEAAARSAARMVFFSSGQVYRPSDQPLSEDAPTYPASRATYYLASKLAGELFVEHCRLRRGLAAVTLRVGSCYGFGMPEKSLVATFMRSARAGLPLEVWGGGTARYDFVSVGDVVRLTLAALQGKETGVFNAGSGRGEPILELAQAIDQLFEDRRLDIRIHPAPPGTVAGSGSAGFSPLSTNKAFAAWGYRPCSLIDGLREYRRHLESASC